MISSMPTTDVANTERFERIGVEATLQTAARTRDEFAGWLKQFFELDWSKTEAGRREAKKAAKAEKKEEKLAAAS